MDAHVVPNKKSNIPIFSIAGKPDIKRNTVITKTKNTAKKPQSVKMIFIVFSIISEKFFIGITAYLTTGIAPACSIRESAFLETAKLKNSSAAGESTVFFLVTNIKLR